MSIPQNEFTTNIGSFLSIEKCNEWRAKYIGNQEQTILSEVIHGYFFGKDNIQHLLNIENSVGIRIYYGIDIDDTGKEIKKMIILPVDKDGNDIQILLNQEVVALDGGWPCPPYCGGTTKPPTI